MIISLSKIYLFSAEMDENATNFDELKENLSIQLCELEMLQSMFPNPGEIRVEDIKALEAIKHFQEGNSKEIPPYLDFTINLLIDNTKFEICINLSHEYPHSEPDIFVRNHELNRIQHTTLNKQLSNFITSLSRDEPCIFSAISWLQDNSTEYKIEKQDVILQKKTKELIRYWIYSHHIYSKIKRREILNTAHDLNLKGFCLPGKPGIICVEGNKSDCDEWWSNIKSMNWKRIFCKLTEECKNESNFQKFSVFEELVFQTNGSRSNHMDMGKLNKYLKDNNCEYIFKDLFGVDSKTND